MDIDVGNKETDKSIVYKDYGYKEEVNGENYAGEILIDRFNKRLKVISYKGKNAAGFVTDIKKTAIKHNLDKIIFNAKEEEKKIFITLDFMQEGTIPGFFNREDCYCLSCFLNEKRAYSPHKDKENDILEKILNSSKCNKIEKPLSAELTIRPAKKQDTEKLVKLYQKIFSTYPSPLLNVDYVLSVINDTVHFMSVFKDDDIVSAASAELDFNNNNAEVTDCATLPEYRGEGLLTKTMLALEKELFAKNIFTLYSLARAGSFGMNAALHKMNYRYSGRMVNNCHIAGRFEDMNIWVKTNTLS